MKYKWLNKVNNDDLIVFFNGWGMDESVVSHLDFANHDLLMFYNYNSIETDFPFYELDKYSTKTLVAWSMGVMTASLFDINYDYKVAINGTLKPIDNMYGIPVRIYDLTEKNFCPKSRDIFVKNMFNGNFHKIDIQRNFEEQKTELIALKKYIANYEFKYDKILISENDNIIPTKNQVRFWGLNPNINGGHAPFFQYKQWEDLLC